jgi:hypothetical protein
MIRRCDAVYKQINLLIYVGTSNKIPTILGVDRLAFPGKVSQHVCTTRVPAHVESFGYS